MTRLNQLRGVLRWLGETYRERGQRWPGTGLAAFYGSDSASRPAIVKDISGSGICLLTEERGHTGDFIVLILRKQGEPEYGSDLQISVRARVIRMTEDGFALAFAPPSGTDAKLFEILVRNITLLTDPDQSAEMFCTFRTVLFLYRLCGAEAEEAILLLDGQLDTHRTVNLFKIALGAENILALVRDADSMRAHPKLVASILRHGAWAHDERTLQLWKGLFVSSCSMDAPDDSNQILVDLLIQLTPTQVRILIHAFERFLGPLPEAGSSASEFIVLNPNEIVQLTGVYDLARNATDLAYLFNLGLIERVYDFTSYRQSDRFDITPTCLGLELYKHCHGSHEKLESHLVQAAREHLAIILSPPPSTFAVQPPAPFASIFGR
jgi:hypothetical protein